MPKHAKPKSSGLCEDSSGERLAGQRMNGKEENANVLLPPLQFDFLSMPRAKSEDIETTSDKCALRNLLCSPKIKSTSNSPSPPRSFTPIPLPKNNYAPKFRDRREAPVYKLTRNLHQIYASISHKSKPHVHPIQQPEMPDLRYDNEQFEYKIKQGEILNTCYKVVSALGKGTFGQVVKCLDMRTDTFVALKVIKSHSSYTQQAKKEIDILLEINNADQNDQFGILRLLSYFTHHNHLCLVFELLACDLYELIKKSQSLSLHLIRKFSYQLLNSLHFLSSEGVDIIHSDLKPENILLRESNTSGIKIIDFGSSCRSNEKIYSYIQSRFYRAPEVLLGMDYSHAIDMWSLGCILVELHTGVPIFPGRDSADQMKKIIELVGIPPAEMIQQSSKAYCFFQQDIDGNAVLKPELCRSFSRLDLRELVVMRQRNGTAVAPPNTWTSRPGHTKANYDRFLDLLTQMLEIDPAKRIRPLEALHHPFFTEERNWCDISPNSNFDPSRSAIGKRRAGLVTGVRYSQSPKKIRKQQSN
mmetsp:Transcript_15118/g.19120  ORF Transcript_15118/g.19120 Transcript_15118/m.19120 type:complete len:529 (-) Transcript_15118:64-1650(-)